MVPVDRLRQTGLRATALCAAFAVCSLAFDGRADAQGGNPGPPMTQPGAVRQTKAQGLKAVDRHWSNPTINAPVTRPLRATFVVGP